MTSLAANDFDTAFGSDGKVVMNGGGEAAGVFSTIFAVAVDPSNGKIYATGPARLAVANVTGISVARQNPDGTPDNTFGVNGRRILSFPNGSGSFYNAQGSSLAILPDGGVVVAGRVTNLSSGGSSGVLFRFSSAGVLDPTFGPDGSGTFVSTFGATGASLNSLVRQSDGSFIAAGGVSSGNFLIAKFTANGTLDTTFGTGGFVTTDFNGGSESAASILLQPDGRIIAGGVSSNDSALARYNANGSLDTSFGTGGKVVTAVVPNNPDNFRKIQWTA